MHQTRKMRKQERRLKKLTKQLGEEEKRILKAIARQMSRQEHPDLGVRFHCRTCTQSWEHAYDNTLVYCRECCYRDCCLKDIAAFRECPPCQRRKP